MTSGCNGRCPNTTPLFSVATEFIPFETQTPIRVLDLGAGTGLFSWQVLQRYPAASFVLMDLADQLLEAARSRFRHQVGRVELRVNDIRHLAETTRYDLVISSLAIHHLEHADKRDLFQRIWCALRPGGAFINVDQIQAPTAELRELYWNHWLDMVRQREPDEARIQASIRRRQTYDRDATLAEQLEWLNAAGFEHVDCVYRHTWLGVFLALK